MTPEQIKAARDWFADDMEKSTLNLGQTICAETVLKALDIVEKLMGEPSELLQVAGKAALRFHVDFYHGEDAHDCAMDVWQSMRDQLLKECE